MGIFKELIKNHYGETVELKYRMFCICATLGTLASLGGFILCAIISGVFSAIGISSLSAFLFMLLLTIYGFQSKKIEMVTTIMSVFLNLIIFPLVFVFSGGLYSVAPIFFIMGILIAVPLTKGPRRSALFLIEFFEYCFIITLCYFYPNISYIREQHIHTTILLFSFMIVSFYIYTSTMMIIRHYDIERSKTDA